MRDAHLLIASTLALAALALLYDGARDFISVRLARVEAWVARLLLMAAALALLAAQGRSSGVTPRAEPAAAATERRVGHLDHDR